MGIISTETKDIKTIPEIENKELSKNLLNIYIIGNIVYELISNSLNITGIN